MTNRSFLNPLGLLFVITISFVFVGLGCSSTIPPEQEVIRVTAISLATPPSTDEEALQAYRDAQNATAEVVKAQIASDATPAHLVPTPVLKDVPIGQALAVAYAQDLEMTWELANPDAVDLGQEPFPIRFDQFLLDYNPYSNEPPELSPLLKALDGKRVVIDGYMAPPLKLGLDWFQLTASPVGACAFCSGASQWTPDIALVYVEGIDEEGILFSWSPMTVVGELHIGENIDIETGMVSLVRIYTDQRGIEEITFSQ